MNEFSEARDVLVGNKVIYKCKLYTVIDKVFRRDGSIDFTLYDYKTEDECIMSCAAYGQVEMG